jgi:hypothetical protein
MSQEIFGLLVRIEATTAGLRAELNKAKKGVDDAAGAFDKGARKGEQAIDRMHRQAAASARLSAEQLNTLKFTASDIIASLGSGMSPMQILLQQGPQVAQAFSFSMSKAAMGVTGFAAVVLAGVAAFESYQSSMRAVTTANRLMGNASGLTAGDLEQLAQRAAETGNISVRAAREQEQAYLRTGRIGGDVMERLIGISKTYATATGQNMDEATKSLAELFSDPVKGAQSLAKEFNLLTDAELKHIEALAASNKHQEAQIELFDKLAPRIKGATEDLSVWSQLWNGISKLGGNLVDGAGRAIGQAVGIEPPRAIGQPGAKEQALMEERDRLKKFDFSYLDKFPGNDRAGAEARRDAEVKKLEDEIDVLRRARNEVDNLREAEEKLNKERSESARQSHEVTKIVDKNRVGQKSEIKQLKNDLATLDRNRDNTGVSESTRSEEAAARERMEHRLFGLEEAERLKMTLEEYKQSQRDAELEYSKTLPPAEAERHLARRRLEIDQIGTLTTETERLSQRNGLLTEQNVEQFRTQQQIIQGLDLQTDATERLADAAGKGEAAIRKANAENEIAAAYARDLAEGIAVEEAAARQEAATRKQIAAEQSAELDNQMKHQQALNAILGQGPEAVEELRIQEQARTMALREGIEGTDAYTQALDRYLKKLRDLSSEEKTGVLQGAVEGGNFRKQQDLGQIGMLGMTDREQAKAEARMRATEELRRMGITSTQNLTEAQKLLVEQVYAQADAHVQASLYIAEQRGVYDELEGVVDQTFDRIGGAITEAFAQGEMAALDFKAVGRAVVSELFQELLKLTLINPLKNFAFGTALTTIGNVGNMLIPGMTHGFGNVNGGGGTYGGTENGPQFRAAGGPVMPGQGYIVGEKRPEYFVPQVAGRILPRVPEVMAAGSIGGVATAGDTIHVNLNVSTGVQATVKAELMGMMPQITNATKAAVADSRQRGGAYSRAMGR